MLSSRRFLRYTMRYLHDTNNLRITESCLRLCRQTKQSYKSSSRGVRTSSISAATLTENKTEENCIPNDVREKLLYCEYVDGIKLKRGYLKSKIIEDIEAKTQRRKAYKERVDAPVYSIALENMIREQEMLNASKEPESEVESKPIHMPYSGLNKYETIETKDEEEVKEPNEVRTGLNKGYKILYEKFLETDAAKSESLTERYDALTEEMATQFKLADDLSKVPPDWMTDYDQYDDTIEEQDWQLNYGTPEPESEVSAVPCGGCGALLHCKDSAIPGYLPSELFMNKNKDDLNTMTCQRCHFMTNYNTSLAVNVAPEEYPKLLSSIKSKRAAVILLVDLMDFPCSIWPDILSIIGTKRPVFVVGNKVDLLPQDSPNFLKHVEGCLSQAIAQTGINKANIQHVALVSAKTGFGIEQLINKLHKIWEYKGQVSTRNDQTLVDGKIMGVTISLTTSLVEFTLTPMIFPSITGFRFSVLNFEPTEKTQHDFFSLTGHVYLIGCTNSGKSTLFNALLQSDYCKSQAVDLIQRATTSPWPGTTLNLLKFPILRPSGWRLSDRVKRLRGEQLNIQAEQQLRRQQLNKTKNLKYAELIGHIGRTFTTKEPSGATDLFSLGGRSIGPRQNKLGVDINTMDYKNSHWCYDTPGTVQPDQVLHLLTTDELMLTLPKRMIIPRTFCIQPRHTLFLGGLGRLDYTEGERYIRVTVFASAELPVTICYTDDASYVYDQLLSSEVFVVPFNDPERLKLWPKLRAKDFQVTGLGWEVSAADIVLSSAGWVAVTPGPEKLINLKAWTPEGRGIYLRSPALLKHSVELRGNKARDCPAYHQGTPVYRRP